MANNTDTARRLAEMNDVAAFERIAASVLRAANSSVYANLSHPGVQPGGKTVKAPFDNVGWVQSTEGARFVCAAHTTDQKDLKGKWLHDPAKVKPRKPGGKPTKPAGDLIKGIAEIQRLRDIHPNLAVTFALTTNQETSLDLRVSVETLAHAAGIELDIWPVSRLAYFLDTDPAGQIIRRNHLGISVKLMSRELLLELGQRSFRDHLPLAVAGENIRRDGFVLERGDTLVVGASGMGKTTACASALGAYLESELPAIVLKTELLVNALTIDTALEGELRRQEPELEAGAGGKALALCTLSEPLLILIEDVNRTASPELLLNKLLSWTRAPERLWRAVCPIWPRYLDVIEDQERVLAALTVVHIDGYTPAEAVRAVRKRADVLQLQIDEHRAASIANRLGRDPLLIGLHDLVSDGTVAGVIQTYINERLRIVAIQAQRTNSEVIQALYQLVRFMLQHRTSNPSWVQVKTWIADPDAIALLRRIASEGSVIRMSGASTTEALEFRHDRVMYSLFSGALVDVLGADSVPDYVTDPFFAEAVAGAIVKAELPLKQLLNLMDETPSAGAHALKVASELDSRYIEIAAQALSQWLRQGEVKSDFMSNRRYAVAHVLSETTSPHVRQLVAQFPSEDHSSHPLLAASFRNGGVLAGLVLLSMYEIGVTVAGKEDLLALVKRMYGSNLVAAVAEILSRTDLSEPGKAGLREGALRLAGYLGADTLAQAVHACWSQNEQRNDELRSYLFAAARCCGGDPERTLGPVCDAWERLPEEPASTIGQPAERLAAENVAWEFGTYIPRDALRYFVERANASEKLRWPITYMLRTVDHPHAVEQLARYAAKCGFINAQSLKDDWERKSREIGKRMSPESRKRLMMIARDEAECDDVRKQAFAFWELTLDDKDLEFVRQIAAESPLYERSLWARARRHDRTVIPEVLRKMPEAPEHWLQISRYLWSNALTDALNPLLDQVGNEQGESYTNLEYAAARALTRVEPKLAISMLSSRWAKMKRRPLMVQIALLSTVPEAGILVRAAFDTSKKPGALLMHFVTTATIEFDGQIALSTPAQLQNLRPYIDLLTENEVEHLWRFCTKRGWLEYRTQCLDPRMQRASDRHIYLPDDPIDTADLDRALGGTVLFFDHWMRWQVERGAAREKVFAAMLDWLGRHNEDRALAIVAEVVSHVGTRREFHLFETAARQRAGAASILSAVRFDVFSRSLV
ncbi:hypothetical protein ABL840_01590 [Variovorax sp. NFACC27]|uniref:hypothetical protein n=1 Tax=unclassified Variovorax TaxID=663243 RepID=UPI000895F25B|nr:hypothetical protein SAMN03159371_07562 [Variovorax sp. NFACC28]SEG99191.1 hypothetical protein SAMN03159365_07506 [Variovorax sp. NFACC29]SFE19009.1 hypothetical protein SAMN03159379_07505 [Variovorax sp. NFACC26]SFH24802.1 hypothetical protein SAMN03159447_07445 [Variovorax sp. NFACC27]